MCTYSVCELLSTFVDVVASEDEVPSRKNKHEQGIHTQISYYLLLFMYSYL